MPPDAEQPDIGEIAFPGAVRVVPAEPFAGEDFAPAAQSALQDVPSLPEEEVALVPVPGHDEASEAVEESAKPKPRGRRGGRRRKADQPPAEQAAPPPYSGPTPADPFGNMALDIFDVIERAESQPPITPSAPQPAPVEPSPAEPAGAVPEPDPAAATAESEEALQDNEAVGGPAIKPVLIGEGQPAAERKRGWWRR